jgi:hypothetical protein
MPTTERRLKYMEGYAKALSAQYRIEAIKQAVDAEQDRVQYIESLIADAEQTRAALSERFAAKEVDFADARALVEQQTALDLEAARLRGVVPGRVAAATSLPPALDTRGADFYTGATRYAVEQSERGITRQQKQAIKDRAADEVRLGRLTDRDKEVIDARLDAVKDRGVPGLSTTEQEALASASDAAKKAQEAAYFAGPSGVRGGFEGLAEVDRRKRPAAMLREEGLKERADALEASEFATEDEALDAALAIIRTTGDPALIEDPVARTVYDRARAEQAYRNDQRADFEQEVLDNRKRLAELNERKDAIAGAYDDPRQEVLRRELRARGYDIVDPYSRNPNTGEWTASPDAWKNSYLQYQNTPEHAYYIEAHERMMAAEGKTLEPSTKGQNLGVAYTMMRDRKGMNTTPAELSAQLQKAGLKGKELADAVSFTMAYWSKGGPNQDPEQAKQMQAAKAQEKKAADLTRERATRDRAEAERLRAGRAQATEDAAARVLGERDVSKSRDDAYRQYTRDRAMGKSETDARASLSTALEILTAPAPVDFELSGEVVEAPPVIEDPVIEAPAAVVEPPKVDETREDVQLSDDELLKLYGG